jgi:DNA-nicking Smr family endonuclease
MRELDLHGLKHNEVEDEVEDFIISSTPPFRIITGKSEEMRRMVKKLLDHYEFNFYIPAHNAGEIIVIE